MTKQTLIKSEGYRRRSNDQNEENYSDEVDYSDRAITMVELERKD